MDISNYLATKLYMPPIKNNHISRQTLINKLNDGRDKGHKVILVSAEAGYGKTTLVSEWISRLDLNYAWLSLDKYDNDSVTFINYLILAVRKVDEAFGFMMENLMSAPRLPNVKVISSYIIEELSKLKDKFILVFDDYQVITNTYIHKFVQRLIDSNVQSFLTVIITRQEPPLTISQWRAKDRLTELGTDDLRLTIGEIQDFFIKKFNLCFEGKTLEILEKRTEGWAAALQLFGLSFANTDNEQNGKDLIKRLSGNNRFIADYLMEEVFERQSVQIRAFLRKTSILHSFNEQLCDAVIGTMSSKQIIEQLERQNLFIVPLDSNHSWYRYHHLFSEFLSAGLDGKLRTEVLIKASKWCEANGYIELAADYALEAEDRDIILGLVDQVSVKYLNDGAIKKLLELLNTIKRVCEGFCPEVEICRAWCLFLMGDTTDACKILKELSGMNLSVTSNTSGKIKALEASAYASTDRIKAIMFANEAVSVLKDENRALYNIALRTLGVLKISAGELTQAAEAFSKIIDGVNRKDYRLIELSAFANYTYCLIAMGRRQEAQDLCEELIDEYMDEYGNPLPLAKMVYLPMGVCLYIANDLERAKSYMRDAISLCEEMKLISTIDIAVGVYIKLLYISGEKSTAFKKLYKYESLSKGSEHQSMLAILEAIEINMRIKEKNNVNVTGWLAKMDGTQDNAQFPYHDCITLTYIRALIEQESFAEAAARLAVEEESARKAGRYEELITILILSALVNKYCNDESKALEYISEAIRIAAPEEYVSNFLEEGEDVIALTLKVRHIAPKFVDKLNRNSNTGQAYGIFENLKAKELEIIRLIAEGMSNDEISKKLYITIGTVKWYINNIYAKIGVNKRTQAVKKAQQLGIIK